MLDAIVNALVSAGASEEIIAAAVKAGGDFGNSPPRPNGRPRKHFTDRAATPIERVQASRARRKSGPCFETSAPCFETSGPSFETSGPCFETEPLSRNEIRDEIPGARRPSSATAARQCARHRLTSQNTALSTADDDARHQRKIERGATALEHDIAGEPPQPEPRQDGPHDP